MKRTLIHILVSLLILTGVAFAEDTSVQTVIFKKKLKVPVNSTEIDLGKITVSPDDTKEFYAFLEQLPDLKKVDMFSTKMPRYRIEKLAERFPDIEFGWTMSIAGRTLRTDATSFSTRHSGSTTSRYSSDEFSLLKYCRNLYALDIGHNNVRDLSFLYDLPQLRVLILVDNKFTDITPVGSLKNLQYLELFYNTITDITPLKELTNLVDLNICYNRIKDWTPLENLRNLRRLWLWQSNSQNVNNKFDPQVAEQLQKALPDTYIDYLSQSVQGGWREGSHYEAIRRMFSKDGVYEPFDDIQKPQ